MTGQIGPRLVIASHNAGKVREIGTLMAPYGIEVVSAADLDLPEPAETARSFAGNARIKAHAAAKAAGLPALSDDSGLEVEALSGAPGVHTADWAETGAGRDFEMAMGKVNDLLDEMGAPAPRRARFVCTLCVAWPDGTDRLFEGTVAGSLVWPPRGERGFGFDPMFLPQRATETFGEMDPDRKHAISHRAHAFARLKAALLD